MSESFTVIISVLVALIRHCVTIERYDDGEWFICIATSIPIFQPSDIIPRTIFRRVNR